MVGEGFAEHMGGSVNGDVELIVDDGFEKALDRANCERGSVAPLSVGIGGKEVISAIYWQKNSQHLINWVLGVNQINISFTSPLNKSSGVS